MKRIIALLIVIGGAIILTPAIHSASEQKPITIENKETPYELPYSGLLPDHPLYFLKILRDTILIITTRGNDKKAELYRHLSDKQIVSALRLSEKGKDSLALDHALQAEELFLKIPPLLKIEKKQEGKGSGDLISKLHLSNAKHREVIAEIIENTTQTRIDVIKTLIMKNEEGEKALNSLQ